MHWTIGQFPELSHLEPAERAKVLSRIPRWAYPLMVARAGVGALFVTVLASIAFTLIAVGPTARIVACVIVSLLAAIFFYLNEVNRIYNAMRNELVERFRGKRPPFCLSCGYDLRASKGGWCPECGGKLG